MSKKNEYIQHPLFALIWKEWKNCDSALGKFAKWQTRGCDLTSARWKLLNFFQLFVVPRIFLLLLFFLVDFFFFPAEETRLSLFSAFGRRGVLKFYVLKLWTFTSLIHRVESRKNLKSVKHFESASWALAQCLLSTITNGIFNHNLIFQ